MQAKPFLFRFRFVFFLLIYVLGFLAPWNLLHHVDSKRDTWSWLMVLTSTHTSINFQNSAILFLALGTALALIAALLRTWAAAYMSPEIVHDQALHGAQVVAAGPYRRTRNPLYLATFIHTLALALLMPPTGALFAILAVALLELVLISREELFLTAQLGQPYLDYKSQVPSIFPAISPRVASSFTSASWPNAMLGEIYYWGVFVTFAFFGRQYNAMPLLRGVLISLGLSLIVRAILPRPQQQIPAPPQA